MRASLLVLLLSGCALPGLSGPYVTDADGDGFTELQGDCDDEDAAIGPHAVEACNGVDDDCDDLLDEDDPDAIDVTVWHADADGDGLGDPATPMASCIQPTGMVSNALDCDDGDPNVGSLGYTWYRDGDGDGHGVPTATTTSCVQPDGFAPDPDDCDDADPDVHPGADDPWDAIDHDCDGRVNDFPMEDVDLLLEGAELGGEAGAAVAGAGDLDGDGLADVVLGAAHPHESGASAGNAYVVYGAADGVIGLDTADATIEGTSTDDRFGISVAGAGDVDGDGFDDLLVGSAPMESAPGVIYLFSGPVAGDLGASDAAARLLGPAGVDDTTCLVAHVGDVHGDGYADVLLGAPDASRVWIFAGPRAGTWSVGDAETVLVGERSSDRAGWASAGGDFDGDGLADLLVGAPWHVEGGVYTGAAYVVSGPPAAEVALEEADAVLLGDGERAARAGWSVAAGDLDGDGHDDVVLGAPTWVDGDLTPGAALVHYGPDLQAVPDAILVGAGETSWTGYAVSVAGDFDGDGAAELWIGAPNQHVETSLEGVAWLVEGPVLGTQELDDAALRLAGTQNGQKLGTSVAGAGDVDGDGRADVLVGAPGTTVDSEDTGAAFLLLGRAL